MSTYNFPPENSMVKENGSSNLISDGVTSSLKRKIDMISSEATLTSLDAPDDTMVIAKRKSNLVSEFSSVITKEKKDEISNSLVAVSTSKVIKAPVPSTFDKATGNLMQFTLYPELPMELRLEIWKNTMKPRLVVVEEGEGSYLRSPTEKPMIFTLCHDSRVAALDEYEILGRNPSTVYFNPCLDTINFRSNNQYLYEFAARNPCFKEAASKIQFIAIHSVYPGCEQNSFFPEMAFKSFGLCFKTLKNLKELIVVREHGLWENFCGSSTCRGLVVQYQPVYHDVQKIRPIKPKEELKTSWLKSEFVREKFTSYLEKNFKNFGGSSESMMPEVKFWVEEAPLTAGSSRTDEERNSDIE